MGTDCQIDPRTRDLVPDGTGGYERTTGAETALYYQIQQALGWVLGPDEGSRLGDLNRAKSIEGRTVRELQGLIVEALAPLVAAGMIGAPDFHGERELALVIGSTTVVDLSRGEAISLADVLDTPPP